MGYRFGPVGRCFAADLGTCQAAACFFSSHSSSFLNEVLHFLQATGAWRLKRAAGVPKGTQSPPARAKTNTQSNNQTSSKTLYRNRATTSGNPDLERPEGSQIWSLGVSDGTIMPQPHICEVGCGAMTWLVKRSSTVSAVLWLVCRRLIPSDEKWDEQSIPDGCSFVKHLMRPFVASRTFGG